MFEISFGAIGATGSILAGVIFVISFSIKFSTRLVKLESKTEQLEEDVHDLNVVTNRDKLEELVTKICSNVVQSNSFKESMKETMKAVILHEQNSRAAEELGKLDLVLEEIKKLKSYE